MAGGAQLADGAAWAERGSRGHVLHATQRRNNWATSPVLQARATASPLGPGSVLRPPYGAAHRPSTRPPYGARVVALQQPCPCGSGQRRTTRAAAGCTAARPQAATAEELMRSRYAAYAVGDADHVFRTWHPRTRPDDLDPDPALTWTGLTDRAASGEDWVEFVASYDRGGGRRRAARAQPVRAARRPLGVRRRRRSDEPRRSGSAATTDVPVARRRAGRAAGDLAVPGPLAAADPGRGLPGPAGRGAGLGRRARRAGRRPRRGLRRSAASARRHSSRRSAPRTWPSWPCSSSPST